MVDRGPGGSSRMTLRSQPSCRAQPARASGTLSIHSAPRPGAFPSYGFWVSARPWNVSTGTGRPSQGAGHRSPETGAIAAMRALSLQPRSDDMRAAGESCRVHTCGIDAHAPSHVIDDVGNVDDVVGPTVLDRHVPPGAVGLQRGDRKALPRGDDLEAAVFRLTLRRSAAAVQIEHEGQPRATVIALRHEQPVGTLTLTGNESLLGDAGRVRQIACCASRGGALGLRGRSDPYRQEGGHDDI